MTIAGLTLDINVVEMRVNSFVKFCCGIQVKFLSDEIVANKVELSSDVLIDVLSTTQEPLFWDGREALIQSFATGFAQEVIEEEFNGDVDGDFIIKQVRKDSEGNFRRVDDGKSTISISP